MLCLPPNSFSCNANILGGMQERALLGVREFACSAYPPTLNLVLLHDVSVRCVSIVFKILVHMACLLVLASMCGATARLSETAAGAHEHYKLVQIP